MTDILTAGSVPFVLVATKCDLLSPDEPFETSLGGYEIHQTSIEMPHKQKMCIAMILREVFSQRDGECPIPLPLMRERREGSNRELGTNLAVRNATIALYKKPPRIMCMVVWCLLVASMPMRQATSALVCGGRGLAHPRHLFSLIPGVRLFQNSTYWTISVSPPFSVELVSDSVANISVHLVTIEKQPGSSNTHEWHHTRARSENPTPLLAGAAGGPFNSAHDSGVDGHGVDRYPTDSTTSPNLASSAQGSRNARSNSHPVRPQTPPSRLNSHRPPTTVDSSPGKDHNRQQRLHTAWRNSGGSDAFNSFLDMEDDIDGPRSAPSSPESKDKASSESSSNETGFTFDELVDRLIAQPMSKQDSKFASIFLCLYRKFAAPATLLNALISRFERNEKNTTDQLTRIADQLRLLNVVAQWVSEYAGDLAYPTTRKRILDFVITLERSHFYMFAAKEIGSYLEVKPEDDDVGWAFKDGEAEAFEGQETFLDNSARSSPSMFLGGFSGADEGDGEDQEEEEDPIYSMSALDLSEGIYDQPSKLSTTLSNPLAVEKPGTVPNQSFTCLSLDAAQKEGENLDLTGRISLSKVLWRQLMEIPDEDFANELTRIDWIMFNTFRPRDLVRHVSLSGPDKDSIQSLKQVNRMIKQFNHVAFFVASVILLRDKPKHRARALEKFMNIAQVGSLIPERKTS